MRRLLEQNEIFRFLGWQQMDSKRMAGNNKVDETEAGRGILITPPRIHRNTPTSSLFVVFLPNNQLGNCFLVHIALSYKLSD